MDTLQKKKKSKQDKTKGGLGADTFPPARTITSKPPHKSPKCVCVCMLHALIALAHHDAAQNANNEPTLWFLKRAIPPFPSCTG